MIGGSEALSQNKAMQINILGGMNGWCKKELEGDYPRKNLGLAQKGQHILEITQKSKTESGVFSFRFLAVW